MFSTCGRRPLYADTRVIDSGGATDSYFTGGIPFVVAALPPGSADNTLRYAQFFSYQIPAENIPYLVTFRFIESTVQAARLRQFSITINDQPAFTDIDLFASAGYMVPTFKSIVVMGGAGLNILFQGKTCYLPGCRNNAVVSSIEVTPTSDLWGNPTSSLGGIRELVWAEYITKQQPDGSYQLQPPPGPYGGPLTIVGPVVFRNGRRQIGGKDFNIDPMNSNRAVPIGEPWPATDEVLTEYIVVLRGGPTSSTPVPIASALRPVIYTVGDRPGLSPAFAIPADIVGNTKWQGGAIHPKPGDYFYFCPQCARTSVK